jgi:ubiquinone/menaquinone biosynthesis C-methylase UbiE
MPKSFGSGDGSMDNPVCDHRNLIIDHFTKYAIPFDKRSSQHVSQTFDEIQTLFKAAKDDTVLDVASGTGSLAVEFAKICNKVIGIDLTPAMVEKAKKLQEMNALDNIRWDMGDVTQTLPYTSNSFSIVTTTFSFHHMLDPLSVLMEMNRVCSIGGKIIVVDITPRPEKASTYNQLQHLKDPSHVNFLTISEFEGLFQKAGIPIYKRGSYRIKTGLEDQLQLSDPTSIDRIRQMFIEDIKYDTLGLQSHYEGNEIYFSYPISICVGQKTKH